MAKKATPKKAAKKASAKKTVSKAKAVKPAAISKADLATSALLSKIQVTLDGKRKRSLSKTEIARAAECLSRTGKILISLESVIVDGTKSGTDSGTQLID